MYYIAPISVIILLNGIVYDSSALGAKAGDDDDGGNTRQADLTTYESYPTDTTECVDYNGCSYEGQFAYLPNKMSEDWVENNNIISVFSSSENVDQYANHTFQITQGDNSIQAVVYDKCADSDCNGCCSQNSQDTGFLIDMEKYTAQRFGVSDGVVQWQCIDC